MVAMLYQQHHHTLLKSYETAQTSMRSRTCLDLCAADLAQGKGSVEFHGMRMVCYVQTLRLSTSQVISQIVTV
eukprot:4044132-Amphidinium_carterae.1